MVRRSSWHLPFTFSKKYISWPILVKLRIKHHQVWKGKGCMGFLFGRLDWNSGIYRRIMGKTLKKVYFSETLRPTTYRFMSWIICYICLSFVMLSCAYVYWCLVVTCWERADLLATFVMSNCEVVTFPLVAWVRCGACLYQFLILPFFLLCGHPHKSCHPSSWCLYSVADLGGMLWVLQHPQLSPR